LQVVRHFWERNDTKGAINALEKLPDQYVRIFLSADVSLFWSLSVLYKML